MPPLEKKNKTKRNDKSKQRKKRLRDSALERGKFSCCGPPAGARTSKDDCYVVFKVALSGFLKDAKSVYLTKGLQPMKKNAVHNAFFSSLTFCATSLFLPCFLFFLLFYFENYDYRYLFTVFFFQNSLFILILMFCAKKKKVFYGENIWRITCTYIQYISMYRCIYVYESIYEIYV